MSDWRSSSVKCFLAVIASERIAEPIKASLEGKGGPLQNDLNLNPCFAQS